MRQEHVTVQQWNMAARSERAMAERVETDAQGQPVLEEQNGFKQPKVIQEEIGVVVITFTESDNGNTYDFMATDGFPVQMIGVLGTVLNDEQRREAISLLVKGNIEIARAVPSDT